MPVHSSSNAGVTLWMEWGLRFRQPVAQTWWNPCQTHDNYIYCKFIPAKVTQQSSSRNEKTSSLTSFQSSRSPQSLARWRSWNMRWLWRHDSVLTGKICECVIVNSRGCVKFLEGTVQPAKNAGAYVKVPIYVHFYWGNCFLSTITADVSHWTPQIYCNIIFCTIW